MEIQYKRLISANITQETYEKAKRLGIKWGYLIEMGLETNTLRVELTEERDKNRQLSEKLLKLNNFFLSQQIKEDKNGNI